MIQMIEFSLSPFGPLNFFAIFSHKSDPTLLSFYSASHFALFTHAFLGQFDNLMLELTNLD